MLSKYVWENIAQENILCNVGPERADTFSQENNLYNVVWSACANIAQENDLCNVEPQPKNNFAQVNNLQYYLDQCGPTFRKDFTCAMFAQG